MNDQANSDSTETIGERLRTQDNRCTAQPMFCVQEKRTVYGMDPDYSDDVVWIDTYDGATEVPEPEDGEETETIIKTGKMEYWETVMVAFTEEGCKEYLRLNGHNHRRETRIYVASFNRCPEMIAIREFLMANDPGEAQPPDKNL